MSNERRFPKAAMIAVATLARAAATEPRAPVEDARAAETASATPPSVDPNNGADPHLPTGPFYYSAIRRPDGRSYVPACSFRQPVCVHARRGLPPGAVLGTLAALERASTFLVDTLGLPPPMADGRAGGNPGFDLYLVAPSSPELEGAAVMTARDDPDPGPLDRASAFAL